MNRQQRRFADKLRKKSTKELQTEFKKFYPKLNANIVDRQVMDYNDFINSVVITPEMMKEIEQYDYDNRINKEIKFNLNEN